jgi:hypothetical protein
MKLSSHNAVVLCGFLLAATAPLSAGPPFQTDDPEPVPQYHGEIYFASQITQSVEGVSGTAPHGEINYGLLPEMQVHMIVPVIISSPADGNIAYGLGDIEFGVKYRLIKEHGALPQIGTFPHVEYPIGDLSRGLGSGYWQIFLPLWFQKSWGPWTTYGGGGYWFHLKNNSNNSWFFGWELQREFSETITTGVEFFTNTAAPKTEVGFDAGITVRLSKTDHLLVSLGRDIKGNNSLLVYAAYLFTFGPD